MTAPRLLTVGRARALALACTAIAVFPSRAMSSTEAGASVSLSAAAASNPFQSSVSSSSTASASLGLSPWVSFTESASKLTLAGDVRITEYARNFARTESFRVSAKGFWQLEPRLRLNADIAYSESIVGETNLVDNLAGGTVVVIEDPTLIGLRTRRRAFNTSVGVDYSPDARQQVTMSWYASNSRFANLGAGNDYVIYGQTIGYSRAMRRGTLGGTFNLQRYECRAAASCSQVVASPQFTGTSQLDARWSLSASAGVSIATLRLPTGRSTTVTPSASANLCRKDPRLNLCFTASHTVEATVLDGARPILSAGVSASYRATDRNTISINGSYATSTRSSLQTGTFRYFSARLTDEHRLNRRASVFVTGSYADGSSSLVGVNRRANVEVSAGLRFSLGRGA